MLEAMGKGAHVGRISGRAYCVRTATSRVARFGFKGISSRAFCRGRFPVKLFSRVRFPVMVFL